MQKEICKNINRRSFIIGGLATLATLGICWRFYDIQILKNSYYNKLSENNKTQLLSSNTKRGIIIDDDGIKIATNKKFYNIFCNPKEVKDKLLVLNILKDILKLSSIEVDNFNRYFNAKKSFLIKSTFNWNEVSLLEFKSNYLSGIYVNQEYKRFYSFGEILSHIVGYTTYYNHSYSGKLGLEALYDEKLKSKPGVIKRKVDSRGRIVKEFESKEPIKGEDIQVSISAKLQSYIYTILKGYKGSISVIEINTGKIKAIANSPSYNNNIFSKNISVDAWNKLNQDKDMPLVNRALSFTFQPGSTFKPIAALAALETGIIDQNTKIRCDGYVKIGNRRFHCWKKSGHGEMNVSDAISQSCNVYFYKLALQLKIDELTKIAYEFGLGDKLFTGLKEETNGVIPTQVWREKNLKNKWHLGDTVNTLIGHGYLLCTPFQLAVMTGHIASGRKIIPTFDCNMVTKFEKIDINDKNLKIIQESMFNTLNGNLGILKRFASSFQKIAGKTGTAQVLNTENLHFTEDKEHSLFVGYAPYDNPKYCISVVLENAGSGRNAAKLAVKSLDFAMSN